MPRVVVMLQRKSAQVAALSPVQWAANAPVPKKLDLQPCHIPFQLRAVIATLPDESPEA